MRQSKAFPQTISIDGISSTTDGLTKREYFAAAAMQGMISNQDMLKLLILGVSSNVSLSEAVAENARTYADALLKALGE